MHLGFNSIIPCLPTRGWCEYAHNSGIPCSLETLVVGGRGAVKQFLARFLVGNPFDQIRSENAPHGSQTRWSSLQFLVIVVQHTESTCAFVQDLFQSQEISILNRKFIVQKNEISD